MPALHRRNASANWRGVLGRVAAALQQRTSATDLADITRHFGIVDIREILARITRGLLRAAALEARLISHPIREPATPATPTVPSPRQPRPAQRRPVTVSGHG